MAAGALICTGDVTVAADGAPLCSGYWSLVPVPEPFTVNEQVIADFATAFGVGFSLVFFCWASGWGIKTVLSLLKSRW